MASFSWEGEPRLPSLQRVYRFWADKEVRASLTGLMSSLCTLRFVFEASCSVCVCPSEYSWVLVARLFLSSRHRGSSYYTPDGLTKNPSRLFKQGCLYIFARGFAIITGPSVLCICQHGWACCETCWRRPSNDCFHWVFFKHARCLPSFSTCRVQFCNDLHRP